MLRTLLERLIGRLKREPGYRLEGAYPTADLLELLWRRGVEALRGLFVKFKLAKSSGLVFAGRGISIRHGRHIVAGAQLILGDGVLLDGFGQDGIRLGRNVTIGRGATLVSTGVVARPGVGISIGDQCGIGEYSYIGGQGGVAIGSHVLLGPNVRVFSENHRFDQAGVLLRLQGEVRAPVRIEDNCWIGSSSVILAGVQVGSGAVVAAGAVVTRDVPADALVAGVPARIVRRRTLDDSTGPDGL